MCLKEKLKGAGHDDRAQAEIVEAEVIEAYLPKALTREEAEGIVDEVIANLKADGTVLSMRATGIVMKSVTPKIAGRFDGKAVSEIARGRLGSVGANDPQDPSPYPTRQLRHRGR
jgi:uncharacterized protein YqeY